jgi:hypothetical protein
LWKKSSWVGLFRKETLRQGVVLFALVFGIFAVFYTPVVISDTLRGGENTRNFFEALGSKAEKRPLIEKVQKTVTENLKYSCLLTTSGCYTGDVKDNIPLVSVTGFIFFAGILLAIRRIRNEQNALRRDFLMLTLLWLGVFLVLRFFQWQAPLVSSRS